MLRLFVAILGTLPVVLLYLYLHNEVYMVGMIYDLPTQNSSYIMSHDQGREAVRGMGEVKTSYFQEVEPGERYEELLGFMDRRNFDILFVTRPQYFDSTVKLAPQWPKRIHMLCGAPWNMTGPNVGVYDGRMYQASYLTGMAAGAMTKTNRIGYAAGVPDPRAVRDINAFALGVRSVNPKAVVQVSWTRKDYDPAREREISVGLLDAGCDVLAQNLVSPVPQQVAQARGVYSVGFHQDMRAYAPSPNSLRRCGTGRALQGAGQQAEGRQVDQRPHLVGMETGLVDIALMSPDIPETVRKEIVAKKRDIIKGSFDIFAGPIRDQQGHVRVTENQTVSDANCSAWTGLWKGLRAIPADRGWLPTLGRGAPRGSPFFVLGDLFSSAMRS